MKKLKKWAVSLLAFAIAVATAVPVTAMAASGQSAVNPGMVTLQTDRTYTIYDIDGDGKADKVSLKSAHSDYYSGGKRGYLKIYVNGKKAFDFEDPYYKGDATWQYDVKLCTVSEKDIFFFIRTRSETEYFNFCRLYRFQSGRLWEVVNLKNDYKNIFHHREYMDVTSVADGRIKLQWYGQLGAVGGLNWNVDYQLRNGKLYRVSRTAPVAEQDNGRSWTADKSFTVYTTAALKKKAYNVRKGDILKVTQVYHNSEYAFVRLINEDGTAGWIPCPNTYSPYFKEAMYVG